MNVSGFSLAAAPLLPWLAVALLAAAGVLCLAFGVLRRAPGLGWRAIAIAVLLAALVNPSVIKEQRKPRRDVAIIIVDDSPSQSIGRRRQATEAALAAIKERFAGEPDLDLRVIRAGAPPPGAGDVGTQLFAALDRAMAEVPRQRLAGIVMITDGQVNDVPAGDFENAGAGRRRPAPCSAVGRTGRKRPAARRRAGAELWPRRQAGAADHPG